MSSSSVKTYPLHWTNWVLLGVFTLLYAPILIHWGDGWIKKSISIEHEYFSHGLIGLPFAGYLAWMNRKKWQRLPDQIHPLGAVLLVIGGIFYLTGVSEWVNLSFPALLTGFCLWMKGTKGFVLNRFPLLLVLLATPNSVPYLIAPFTLPLQSFIAGCAGFILMQLGMDVTVNGIYIFVGGRVVEVAPYCAGLKMLFTTQYVALMLLYWTGAITSRKTVIWFLCSASALSITANIIRNTMLTYFHGTGKDALFVWLHDSWGGDMYSACMLLLLIPLLNKLETYISQPQPQPPKMQPDIGES